MAVPFVFVGGTKAKASEVNENFSAVEIQRKVFTDATERTTSSVSLVDTATTFALSAPVGALILGITVKWDLKADIIGNDARTTVKINGTNLGTVYLVGVASRYDAATVTRYDVVIASTELELLSRTPDNTTAYITLYAANFAPLKILDATTNLTVRLGSTAGTQVRVRNVEITVIYVDVFNDN